MFGCTFECVVYQDADGDGYGNPANTQTDCLPHAGYVPRSRDCDDSNASINPDQADKPDSAYLDSNCDGIDGDVSLSYFVSPSGSTSPTSARRRCRS